MQKNKKQLTRNKRGVSDILKTEAHAESFSESTNLLLFNVDFRIIIWNIETITLRSNNYKT